MKTVQSFSGVVPSLAQVGDLSAKRSECGVGCLMPWAGKLYVLNYNSHKEASGRGVSLRRVHADMTMEVVPETRGVDGTYTNRFVHYKSNQIVIGPHVIDAQHKIRTIEALRPLRVCGTTWHISDPDKVYVLCMEGEVFELNMVTFECVQVFDLQKELSTEREGMVHFKDCYCHFGKLVVCSNEYNEDDWKGTRSQGRLAEYDGKAWTIIERKPFIGLGGRGTFCETIFSNGWDQASAILKVWTKPDNKWTTYRLPKASHCFDHKWQTEWPRIRETEHERFLMDHHGMFYELSPWAYGGRVWGIRPISTHLWVLGDFCSWRGMLVLGADNASPSGGDNPTTAEPQSGLWFGKTDDLWSFGKPTGWGGPWWETPVKAGEPSDPYLMTGFEHKCIHLTHDAAMSVKFDIEVDFMGHGKYSKYLSVDVAANGYGYHVFPAGFSAHWVRVVPSAACIATAQLVYT
jgi:hypothetical protein